MARCLNGLGAVPQKLAMVVQIRHGPLIFKKNFYENLWYI